MKAEEYLIQVEPLPSAWKDNPPSRSQIIKWMEDYAKQEIKWMEDYAKQEMKKAFIAGGEIKDYESICEFESNISIDYVHPNFNKWYELNQKQDES